MKRKKILALMLCGVMVLGTLAGCGAKDEGEASSDTDTEVSEADTSEDSTADSAAASGETVKIGILCPLTGSSAEIGQTNQTVTEIIVDEINAAGGVNGRQLEYVVYDSASNATQSVDMTRKLADDPEIMAVIGDCNSSWCIADAPIADEAGMMMVSTTASNVAYTPMSEYAFSINGRTDFESPFVCKYMIQKYMGAESVAVLQVANDGSQCQYDYFKEAADELGVEISSYEVYVDGETDFSSIIEKAKASNPDCVFIIDGTNTFSQVVNQIRQSGWDIEIGCLGFGTSEEVAKLCGENGEGLLTTAPFYWDESNEEMMKLKEEFIERNGYDGAFRAAGMRDAIYMVAEAIEQCGDDITRQNVRDNFAELKFDGFTGHIEFLEDGSLSRIYCIFAIEDGTWVRKTDFDYAD